MQRITIAEAAKRAGYSQGSVKRWIAEGLLPAFRVGDKGHYRVNWEDVLALTSRVQAQQEAARHAAADFLTAAKQIEDKFDFAASRKKYRDEWAREHATVH
jgi:excisionase family DNA binding protein